MTTFLLDVNVLIALVDANHVHHDVVHDWFSRSGKKHFATCPITENGLLRIVGHPRYPQWPRRTQCRDASLAGPSRAPRS